MNAKKAKKLRQLTRVMQDKGVVEKEWQVNGHIDHVKFHEPLIIRGNDSDVEAKMAAHKAKIDQLTVQQSVLKPQCGKAVYRAMKKRAML